jgi:enoyl-CoA hydratase
VVAPDHVYDAALAWALRFADYPPQLLAAAKASFGAAG